MMAEPGEMWRAHQAAIMQPEIDGLMEELREAQLALVRCSRARISAEADADRLRPDAERFRVLDADPDWPRESALGLPVLTYIGKEGTWDHSAQNLTELADKLRERAADG